MKTAPSPKIALDARLITYRRGIGNFIFHMLREYAALGRGYQFIVYVASESARAHVPSGPSWHVRTLGRWPYPLWEQAVLPLAMRRDRPDILHSMANTAPLTTKTPLVLTVHDVMYLFPPRELASTPTLYHRLGKQYRQSVVPAAARRAVALTTVSETSRRDITTRLGIDGERIRVVHEAPNSACGATVEPGTVATVRKRYGLILPYVLALAARDPRKNTTGVIRAFARFARRAPHQYQLVLVGLAPNHRSSFQTLARTVGVSDSLVFADFVPEGDLVALYSAAETFIYPSLYEGFGLPVLEAMACGTPVITSDRGALPEVAGVAALQVNPLDPEELANGLLRLSTDAALRDRLVTRGRDRVQRFSWRAAAEAMLDVYEQAVAATRPS
jgi:glycosyltransferase involved in cell wall biosynthesis